MLISQVGLQERTASLCQLGEGGGAYGAGFGEEAAKRRCDKRALKIANGHRKWM